MNSCEYRKFILIDTSGWGCKAYDDSRLQSIRAQTLNILGLSVELCWTPLWSNIEDFRVLFGILKSGSESK